MAIVPQRPMGTSLSSLFPTRLKKRGPYWGVAKGPNKCKWCQDDILEGEKIAIEQGQHGIWCMQCGLDVVEGVPSGLARTTAKA